MIRRCYALTMVVLWAICATLQVQKIASEDVRWSDGLILAAEVALLCWFAHDVLRETTRRRRGDRVTRYARACEACWWFTRAYRWALLAELHWFCHRSTAAHRRHMARWNES